MIIENKKNLYLRAASLKDGEFIWAARNQKTSIVWFKQIQLNDHIDWFKEEYQNKKSFFYVGVVGKNDIGYIRFSMLEKNYPVISYCVKERFQKNGYGSIILKEASIKFFQQHKNIKKVIARTHIQNIASIISFRRAGFKEKRDSKYVYFELSKIDLKRKKISILISGSTGLELLKIYKKQKLKAESIIINKKSSISFIEDVKKTKVSKKIFLANRDFSKELVNHLKYDISLVLSFWWPFIIKDEYINLVDYGILNPHAAYLPYERGVHTYVYSILKNHTKGLTIHFMDKKVDAGLILKRKKIKTKEFISGAELEIIQRKEIIKFFSNMFKKICEFKFNKKKLRKINTKTYLQNFRKDLDKNTFINLNKKYKAIDLLNIIMSRSGFKRGGAHFNFKKKQYEIDMTIREKK